MGDVSLFSSPSPAFAIYRLFNDGHSDQCEVVLHCSFDLHVSNNYWCCVSLHVPIDCMSILEEYLGLLPISWLGGGGSVTEFVWTVCIFWKLSPDWSHCLQIFLPIPWLSFHFVYAVQKLVSLIRSHFFTFAFISVALGDWPKKTLLGQRMFYLRCFLGVFMSCHI